MEEMGYQEATQVLIDHLGRQWQGLEVDGRNEMERLLRDELGYDRQRARETIDAMIRAGTLRYHTAAEEADDAPVVPPIFPAGTGGTSAAGVGGSALPAFGMTVGHWQIGRESDEMPGRAGQVQAG